MTAPTEFAARRPFDGATFARLIQGAKAADTVALAWLYLEAAHIVGQLAISPHLQTHARMLILALRTRDWPEVVGQMLRLALAPVGHLLGRLPLGNPGRSTEGAFKSLAVRPELADLIAGRPFSQ